VLAGGRQGLETISNLSMKNGDNFNKICKVVKKIQRLMIDFIHVIDYK
jgi:hypothetical protein